MEIIESFLPHFGHARGLFRRKKKKKLEDYSEEEIEEMKKPNLCKEAGAIVCEDCNRVYRIEK